MPTVARYEDHRPPDLESLAGAASAEGMEFVARTVVEWKAGTNRFDQAGEEFYVAIDSGAIIGVCGLNIDPYLDDPAVGRVRHLYVHPDHRRIGVGRALVDRCVCAATGRFARLRLRTSNPAADAFYRAIGFHRCVEDAATHCLKLS